jgi:plasmid stabilization system protein ParE
MGRSEGKTAKTDSLRLTEHAYQNISQITGYIAFVKHEPYNAIHVGEVIFKTIDRIANNPFAFPECQELPTRNKIYRKAICMSWLIIFKVKPSEIIILGIIHQHRKPSRIRSVGRIK